MPCLLLLLLLGYRELPIKVIEPIFERSEKRGLYVSLRSNTDSPDVSRNKKNESPIVVFLNFFSDANK